MGREHLPVFEELTIQLGRNPNTEHVTRQGGLRQAPGCDPFDPTHMTQAPPLTPWDMGLSLVPGVHNWLLPLCSHDFQLSALSWASPAASGLGCLISTESWSRGRHDTHSTPFPACECRRQGPLQSHLYPKEQPLPRVGASWSPLLGEGAGKMMTCFFLRFMKKLSFQLLTET